MLEAYLGSRMTNLEKDLAMKQRKAGEQQQSMLLLYMTYILLIAVSWAIFGQKWAVLLAVIAWGVGDAFAALIGKPFGRHKLQGKYIEGAKSIEGSLAMFVSSFIATFLMYRHHTVLSNVWLVLLPNKYIGNLIMTKESRDLIRSVLQGPHERNCLMSNITFGPR